MATPRKRPKTVVECDTELEKVRAQEETRERITPQELAILQEHDKLMRETTATVNVDEELQRLTALGNSVNRSISHVAQQVRDEINNLAELRSAVQLEERTLEEMYGKAVVSANTQNLIAEYDTKKAELDATIAQATGEWRTAKAAYEDEQEEFVRRRTETRAREADAYAYDIEKKRQSANDAWLDEQRVRERAAALKQENLEKAWMEREARVKIAEQELQMLRAESVALPAKLDAAVKKASAETAAAITRDLGYKSSLEKAQAASDLQLQHARNAALTEQVQALGQAVNMLQVKLASAEDKVAAIANKALESASGSRTLAEVTSMIKDRDGTPSRTKA